MLPWAFSSESIRDLLRSGRVPCPVRDGVLEMEGCVIHKGRSSVHVEVVFRNARGERVAKASATQIIRRPADS